MIINRKRLNDSDSFPEHKGCWGLFFLGEFIVIQKNQKSHNSEAFNNSVLFIQFGDPESSRKHRWQESFWKNIVD